MDSSRDKHHDENSSTMDDGAKICPLCQKNFGQDDQKLIEHAATCEGVFEEELTEEICPICQKQYPPEQLPEHTQDCAQAWFD